MGSTPTFGTRTKTGTCEKRVPFIVVTVADSQPKQSESIAAGIAVSHIAVWTERIHHPIIGCAKFPKVIKAFADIVAEVE